MPWTQKQHNLFELIAHNRKPNNGAKIPVKTAQRMAKEPIKHAQPGK